MYIYSVKVFLLVGGLVSLKANESLQQFKAESCSYEHNKWVVNAKFVDDILKQSRAQLLSPEILPKTNNSIQY